MQTLSLVDLIKQVVTSWQVIVVTVGILIYLNIVFFVSRKHHGPSSILKMGGKNKKKKSKPEKAPSAGPEETGGGKDTNEELGLEEA